MIKYISIYVYPHAHPHTAKIGVAQRNLKLQISATFLGGEEKGTGDLLTEIRSKAFLICRSYNCLSGALRS